MLGTIGFEDLLINCVIGNLPHEREVLQTLLVDLQVGVDFGTTDLIKNTICYAHLAETCTDIAVQHKFHLLETLACAIINKLMTEPSIKWATVRIKKPGALPAAKHAFVELTTSLVNAKQKIADEDR